VSPRAPVRPIQPLGWSQSAQERETVRISIISPNLSTDPSIVDIGITYLATYLNQRTPHRARIVDFTYHRKDWKKHLARNIEAFKPDIIGISAVSLYMQYIREILREIKRTYRLPTIVGGYHATLLTEETLAEEGVDAVCVGDGEFALTEYLDALGEGRSPEGIPGIWFKRGGEIIRNRLREPIQDIDNLPFPDYDLWEDFDKFVFYNEVLYLMGTRGCPYNCTYCSEQPMRERLPGKYLRRRDPRAFAREIKYHFDKYHHLGPKVAHAFDPVFTFEDSWVNEFCDEYIKLGLSRKLPFSCFTRADNLTEEKVATMAAAGWKIARLGIEAGNERIRNEVYKKNISNEQFRRVFKWLHKYGIVATGYNMLGGPGEDRKTLQDTFDFVKELGVERPIFFTYRPLPSTRAAAMVSELGGMVDCDSWDKIDSLHQHSNVYTRDLTPGRISRFRYKCLLYFTARRTLRLIREQKLRFFWNMFRYVIHGLKDGVGFHYIVGYFFVSGGENVTH